MVKDIYPGGSAAPAPSNLIDRRTARCSSAPTTALNGYELWKSDGTDGGTVMVKDIYPGTGSS